MPSAFLLAFSDPGSAIVESEYHDWYDDEHVPLRLAIPGISTWTRVQATDGVRPSWAAYFDFDSYESTQSPPYTTLAETRSDREKSMYARLEIGDRRIYEEYTAHPSPAPSALYDRKKPAPTVVFVSTDVRPEAEAEFNKWYDEEHVPMLSKVPGWIRSRRFVLKESVYVGPDAANHPAPPKYLGVHEWESEDHDKTAEHKATTATPWRLKVQEDVTRRERRAFKHYRTWYREE